MKRWMAAPLLAAAILLAVAGTIFAAAGPMGFTRKVRVMVAASRKEQLMDLVQRSFEEEGYRLHKRTTVDIIMERRLSGYLEGELWRIAGNYYDRSDIPWGRYSDPVERLYLSVVRQTTQTTQIEGYRVLCANPDTVWEASVMDDSSKRADALKNSLEQIRNEMEAIRPESSIS